MIGIKGKPRPVETRFWEKVEKTDTCWNWIGAIDSVGYGSLTINGRTYRSHRLSYLLNKGKIPNGLCVLHTCDNRRCVNPNHLFLGTNKDNMIDKHKKSRANTPKGEKQGHAKLTKEKVIEIRNLYKAGKSTRELAKAFGVCHHTIWDVANRLTWKHIN